MAFVEESYDNDFIDYDDLDEEHEMNNGSDNMPTMNTMMMNMNIWMKIF
jgi:hypothetical protein